MKIDAEGHRVEIGMRPGWNVLMPLYTLGATRMFVIQLAVMEFNVRPNQVLGNVGKDGVAGEFPKSRMSRLGSFRQRTYGFSAL